MLTNIVSDNMLLFYYISEDCRLCNAYSLQFWQNCMVM